MSERPTYLLFPAGMPESLAFKATLAAMDCHIIGASSVSNDPAKELYDAWVPLPFIGTDTFDAALVAAIASHRVGTIFTPHSVIAHHLQRLIDARTISTTLIVEPLGHRATQAQASTFTRVARMMHPPLCLDIPGEAPALSALQLATLMHHSNHMVGSTSEEKLLAMAEIFRSCSKGDIVEIGTFWGRSAAILAMLATHYSIGALLCIDPWRNDAAMQEETSGDVNTITRTLDLEAAFRGFLINVAPYAAPGMVNYLRTTSDNACAIYTSASVTSPEFGTTRYTGAIACLHIDGNHGLEAVTNDIARWVPKVIPGGWVIVDDYQWAFGDGPRIAADRWLAANSERIDRAFVIGSALFIRLIDA